MACNAVLNLAYVTALVSIFAVVIALSMIFLLLTSLAASCLVVILLFNTYNCVLDDVPNKPIVLPSTFTLIGPLVTLCINPLPIIVLIFIFEAATAEACIIAVAILL